MKRKDVIVTVYVQTLLNISVALQSKFDLNEILTQQPNNVLWTTPSTGYIDAYIYNQFCIRNNRNCKVHTIFRSVAMYWNNCQMNLS